MHSISFTIKNVILYYGILARMNIFFLMMMYSQDYIIKILFLNYETYTV